jgi:hypothetical protein
MNLVQIQERLKDMPLQAVMQYANGMNPDVPPYLALGELNRRKKMEQAMQPAEMPQGTVKEQLENEVGLAALQKQLMNQLQTQGLRQQQAAMSQGQQMAQMPGPAPQGVPQPETAEMPEEMAGGGVASISVPDDQFEFGSGGIIAFSSGSPGRKIPQSELDIDPLGVSVEGTEAYLAKLAKEAEEKKKEEEAIRAEFLERVGAPRVSTPSAEKPSSPRMEQRFPPGPPPQATQGIGTSTQAPPRGPSVQAPATQGIATVAPQPIAETPAMQALKTSIPQQQPTTLQSYEEELKKAAEKDPYLTKRPGEKLEQYLATLERRDREDQERFQQMEKDRTRSALWKSLMAAGEASRGQKGIGALLGGFGRTAGEELESGRVREEKQALLMREREANRVKMMQEIETARIAASKGDFAAKREADMNAAKFQQKDREITGQLVTNLAQIEAANARSFAELQARAAEGKLNRETQIIVANINAASANRPGEAERIFDEYQRRLKTDPSGKLAEEYMTAIQRAKGLDIRAGDAKTRQIAAQMKPLQEELEKLIANPMSMKDPRVQQLRSELDKLRQQLGGSSQAPLGSRENPIPIR